MTASPEKSPQPDKECVQDSHLNDCLNLIKNLEYSIGQLKIWIFHCKCKDKAFWERLFAAIKQVLYMHETLETYRQDLKTLAQQCLSSFDEWQNGLRNSLN